MVIIEMMMKKSKDTINKQIKKQNNNKEKKNTVNYIVNFPWPMDKNHQRTMCIKEPWFIAV